MSLIERPVIYPPRTHIAQELRRRGLPHVQVAARMEIEVGQLRDLLCGGIPLSEAFAQRLSLATGMPVDFIMQNEESQSGA